MPQRRSHHSPKAWAVCPPKPNVREAYQMQRDCKFINK